MGSNLIMVSFGRRFRRFVSANFHLSGWSLSIGPKSCVRRRRMTVRLYYFISNR